MLDKAAYTREWRKKNPDKVKRYNKNKYESDKKYHPERLEKKREMCKEWYRKNREKHRKYQREWAQNKLKNIKEKIYNKLGHTCIRCGFSDKRALCIDHLNGGGYKEIRKYTVFRYYEHVLADTTGKYQILCHNCNWIKRSENNENRKA